MDKEMKEGLSSCCKSSSPNVDLGTDKELWDKCVAFHGHGCPGLATGFRAAKVAMDKIGIIPHKMGNTFLVVENNGCGVDALQVITGCTFSKANFMYRNTGKMAYSFFNRENGESIRLVLKKMPPKMAWEEIRDYILEAPVEEIFEIKKPHFDPPEMKDLFPDVYDVTCDKCGETVPEHMMRIIDGEKLCLDCLNAFEEKNIHWYCRFKTYKISKNQERLR